MAELVDALDSGSSVLRHVEVQILSRAPFKFKRLEGEREFREPRFFWSRLFLGLFCGFLLSTFLPRGKLFWGKMSVPLSGFD